MAAVVPGSEKEAVIERWMDAYGTMLLRMCCIMLKDYALAEDAAQETFVKAYRHLEHFQNANPLSEKSWLTQIAVNTCRDYRRSAWFRHVDRATAVEDVPQSAEPPNLDGDDLMQAILRLPAKYREVILLYFYQDLKYEDIAQIIGVSKSTVHSRIKKAARKLREALEGGQGNA